MVSITFGCSDQLKSDLEDLANAEGKTLSRFIIQELEDIVAEQEECLLSIRSSKKNAFEELEEFAHNFRIGPSIIGSDPNDVFVFAKKLIRAVAKLASTPYEKNLANEIRELFKKAVFRKDGRDPQDIQGDIARAISALGDALNFAKEAAAKQEAEAAAGGEVRARIQDRASETHPTRPLRP
jgi:hypothetical protein